MDCCCHLDLLYKELLTILNDEFEEKIKRSKFISKVSFCNLSSTISVRWKTYYDENKILGINDF